MSHPEPGRSFSVTDVVARLRRGVSVPFGYVEHVANAPPGRLINRLTESVDSFAAEHGLPSLFAREFEFQNGPEWACVKCKVCIR